MLLMGQHGKHRFHEPSQRTFQKISFRRPNDERDIKVTLAVEPPRSHSVTQREEFGTLCPNNTDTTQLFHHSQNCYHQESKTNRCWQKCTEEEPPYLLGAWGGCKLIQTPRRALESLKIELQDPAKSLLRLYPKESKSAGRPQRSLHTHVPYSTIYNNQVMESG